MRFLSETILKEPVPARHLPAILQDARPVGIRLFYFDWILTNLSINSEDRFEISRHESEWDSNDKGT